MFEEWFKLLERGVVALEKIARQVGQDYSSGFAAGYERHRQETPPPHEMAEIVAKVFEKHAAPPGYQTLILDRQEGHDDEVVAVTPVEKKEPEEFTKEWAQQDLPNTDAAAERREAVKEALRKYGKKFKESARTETLEKMLEEVMTSAVVDSHQVPPTLATKEDVRAALVNLSAVIGKDAALHVLKTIGGADKLSDVSPEKYAEIVEACRV